MLVVTHEIGFARAVADLIVYMDRGEIVEAAPPAAFLDAPADDRTKRFVGQLLGH
jgi:ABC-type polar amino acid transport system ATPase subunit